MIVNINFLLTLKYIDYFEKRKSFQLLPVQDFLMKSFV